MAKKPVLVVMAAGMGSRYAHCDTKEAFSYCRQLTDAGFRRLDEFAAGAMYDPDLMARKMLDYVASKYDEVIKE